MDLPSWVTYRADQHGAADEIVECFERVDVVMLIGPTGSGKTTVAELVRQKMGAGRTAYLCVTNTLLKQVAHDFPYAAPIMGRRNYPTQLEPARFTTDGLSCADCTWEREGDECDWCEEKSARACPYEAAKHQAFRSDLVATNYAYFLTECNGPGRFTEGGKRPFDLVTCDEGDRAPGELSRHTEISISRRIKDRINLKEPRYKTVEASWPEWFDYAIRHIGANIPRASGNLRENRVRRTLINLKKQLTAAKGEVANGEWCYKDYARGGITFQPIYVRRHAPMMLWPHGRKWLFMSATLIPEMVAKELGHEEEMGVVEMASTFPPENRPIYYKAVASVTKRNAEESWPQIAAAIGDIIATYPNERVLVHTVSYAFTSYLMGAIDSRRLMTYADASNRDKMLERFRTTMGAVFLASGMERGIDLPYDDCRVVIVCKVPWPNKGDKLVAKRLHMTGGQFWFSASTVQALVQSAGRAVRAVDDTCDIWVLDEQFLKLYRQEKRLFPGWFREAVRMDGSAVLRERQRVGVAEPSLPSSASRPSSVKDSASPRRVAG